MFYSRRVIDGVDEAVGFFRKRQRKDYMDATGNPAFWSHERVEYIFSVGRAEYCYEANCTMMVHTIRRHDCATNKK
jgi:hypothetical protein